MALKRCVISLIVACICVVTLQAATFVKFEQLTISTVALPFTRANVSSTNTDGTNTGHPQAVWAICTLTGAEIAYTYDGTTPTSTVGQTLEVNQTLTLYGSLALIQFKAIRTGGSDGTLRCHYTD